MTRESFYTEYEDENEAYQAHQTAVLDFSQEAFDSLGGKAPEGLGNALYSMQELGLWPDIDGMSNDDALRAWAIVETLRRNGGDFPRKLRM